MHKKNNLLDKNLFEKLINLYNSGNHKELEERLIFLIKTNPRSYSLFNLLGAVKKSLKDHVLDLWETTGLVKQLFLVYS